MEDIDSTFEIKTVTDLDIVLLDLDKGKSVTNDASQVVAYLEKNIPGGIGRRRVYYRDTMGRFDRITIIDGRFAGFAPCSESQQLKLLQRIETFDKWALS